MKNVKKNDKKNEIIEAIEQTDKLALHMIRLIDAKAKIGEIRQKTLPGVAQQGINIDIKMTPDGKQAIARMDYILAVYYEEPKSDKDIPTIYISSQYELSYSVTSEVAKKDLEKIGAAIQRVAALNSWPYWREFVQSMTTRMGLPAFPVPLLHPAAQLPTVAVKDEARKLPPKAKK